MLRFRASNAASVRLRAAVSTADDVNVASEMVLTAVAALGDAVASGLAWLELVAAPAIDTTPVSTARPAHLRAR
jgi:hypothetical protein